MNHPVHPASTRHGPIARPVTHERDASSERRVKAEAERKRAQSESRLQAAVVKECRPDEGDPYADVPCTD